MAGAGGRGEAGAPSNGDGGGDGGGAGSTVTLKGVTLSTKGRRRGGDVFDVVVAPSGLEIRRPGQPDRHMDWERITEWEIVERRGGVRLTLRGGGSVTPMVVPGWQVDDLDAALRAAAALNRDASVGEDPDEDPVPDEDQDQSQVETDT